MEEPPSSTAATIPLVFPPTTCKSSAPPSLFTSYHITKCGLLFVFTAFSFSSGPPTGGAQLWSASLAVPLSMNTSPLEQINPLEHINPLEQMSKKPQQTYISLLEAAGRVHPTLTPNLTPLNPKSTNSPPSSEWQLRSLQWQSSAAL